MGILTNMLRQVGQQQNAPVAQPALGNLLKTTPSQPAPFQRSSAPWQQQLAGAIDYGSAGGDAWNKIGREGVINYMGDSLMKRYGTNNLSDFRYVEDANTPGGYRLDWQGRQPVNSFLGGIKDASRSAGLSMGAGAGAGSDGLGGTLALEDPSKALNFGATWEGDGGTTFGFKRDPVTGLPRIETKQTESNETGDIIAALAILGGGYAAGTGALGGTAGGAAGGAAEGAVGSGAGFVGEGALSGVGAWDAALASSPSWTAAGGMAGAAGVTDLGGGISMGADGAITGATGLNPSTLSNAGIMESVGYGGAGTATMGAGGAEAIAGTPPPANPYHPASYLSATNLGNLASSAMSNFSWTDLIGPGLQLVGGAMNAKAAGDASQDQLQAAREAAARFEPWRQAGAFGIGRAATMLGKEGPEAARAAFATDPGYQWRLEQGEKGLERAAAARGLLGSGRYLKDAMRFNQGEATQEFGNAYNRLANLAGMGQTATQSSSDFLTQGANAQAAGRVGQANAWNNALGQGVSMYQNNRLMRGLGY